MTSSRDPSIADLHGSIEQWRAWSDRARAIDTEARVTLVEGQDPRGAVTVRIDERWRVIAVRLRTTWRDVVDPVHLGAAVIDAVTDAVESRLQPTLDVVADIEALPGVDLSAVLADGADLGAELTRWPAVGKAGAMSIEAIEAQVAEIDRMLAEQEAAASAIGRSRRHEVEIELDRVGLPVRVACRLDWVRTASVERLTSALAEAFVMAYAAADGEPEPGALAGAA